jgi:hypothetical protein
MIDKLKGAQKTPFVALNIPGWLRETTKKLI